jgi:uncharacterized protein (TIGR01777 family)
MNILITGSTGLVGSNLGRSLSQKGHATTHLVRKKPVSENQVYWDPALSVLDSGRLEGLDAVVHLAGESITGGRWTADKKRRILESRVRGTRLLSEGLAGLRAKPGVLVSASAIGFYGDRGEERLDESCGSGNGFLAEVCRQWEKETEPAAAAGIRVVNLRIGIVLSGAGGALRKMLPLFRMGLGGKIGHGRQYMSWIALPDLVGAIQFAVEHESLRGPVNAVSPEPVQNSVFVKQLGRALSRPTIFFLPRFAARAVLGEMAEALLLASARVVPARLESAGFRFQSESLEKAIVQALSSCQAS